MRRIDLKRIVSFVVGLTALCTQIDRDVLFAQTGVVPASDAPQPLSPEESKSRIRLPDGFELSLVASEPVVQEPSCITFDPHGRLFVCELHGYNVEGEIDVAELNKTGELDRTVRRIRWELIGGEIAEQAVARQFGVVKLLLDDDKDGVMDRAEVWADNLPPCYGVVAANGGIIVACAPDIVFLADRDRDGRVDERKTLFTGFQTRVLERGINNPRLGLDNWIYFGAGGSGGTITGPGLEGPIELPHTDFRIRPDGSAIEPVQGRVGTFGMTINEVGDRFPATGGRPAMYALPLPYRFLFRNPHVATPDTNQWAATYGIGFRISEPHPWRTQRRQDPEWIKFYGERETNSNYFSGGCSNEVYAADSFPREYRGNVFYCEPSLNIIHRCVVERDGPGYEGARAGQHQDSEFLASTDQWFRPMNLRTGPNGGLFIVDMYREIIEDYSAIPRFLQQQYGLDKGREHGRIWRLHYRDVGPASNNTPFAKLANTGLTDELMSNNQQRRLTAQWLLVEREAREVADRLKRSLSDPTTAASSCLNMLYTLDGLGKLTVEDLLAAMRHVDSSVRVHALRLAYPRLSRNETLQSQLTEMVADTDPSVVLQVAMCLGEVPDEKAVRGLLAVSRLHHDVRWIEAAILSSARSIAGELALAILEDTATPSSQTLLAGLCQTIAGEHDLLSIQRVIAALSRRDRELQIASLQGFWRGLPRGGQHEPPPSSEWSELKQMLGSSDNQIRINATKLATCVLATGDELLTSAYDISTSRATDNDLSTEQRLAEIDLLANAPPNLVTLASKSLVSADQPPAIQKAAIEALARHPSEGVCRAILANWPALTPSIRRQALSALLGQTDRWELVLETLENGVLSPSDFTARQRELLLSQPDSTAAKRVKQLLQTIEQPNNSQQQYDRYVAALSQPRNSADGKTTYLKHCASCHQIGNEGVDVGPNLGTLLNKPDESIVADILNPNLKVDSEYTSYIVLTRDGRTATGLLTEESATSLTLSKEKNVSEVILRRDIEQIKASTVSLMPSNLAEEIPPQAMANLLDFIREAFTKH